MPRAIAVSTPVHGGPEETLWSIAREVRRLVDRLGRRAVWTASAILRAPSRTPRTVPEDRASQLPKTLEQRSDEDLLILHREGDPQALRLLIERYSGELHGFLTRLVGSRAGADDVFQEAFLQVHLSAESFDRERRFKPWLYTIAANKARDFHRRRKRRAMTSLSTPIADRSGSETPLADMIESAAEAPSAPAEHADESEAIRAIVDSLPDHHREILMLSYFHRMSYQQISEVLSIPLGTVKSRLHSAVALFSERWRRARGQVKDDRA